MIIRGNFSRSRNVVITRLYCSICHSKVEIWRKTGKQKKNNHIKHLWCIKCKDRTAHVEWNDYFEPQICVNEK